MKAVCRVKAFHTANGKPRHHTDLVAIDADANRRLPNHPFSEKCAVIALFGTVQSNDRIRNACWKTQKPRSSAEHLLTAGRSIVLISS
ncbi:hypothetical protein [Mycolicibacterium bacteremicum]|uniref:hypothetical protein n=1 Tax=Mycolicibacterium bacteremicum TaxID=564198 RepID=UPI0026ECA90D|nr:hypothetical protein [Mycolicibacterium bacteremicum]